MTVTVRVLPTAFGHDEATVTVATPSCCCCCCCLATVTATSTFLASDAAYRASERGAPPELPAVIGAFTVPAAIATLWTAPHLGPIEPWHVAIAVLAVSAMSALRLARVPWTTTVLTTLVVMAAGAALFLVEVIMVFATVAIIEVVTPLAGWGAWAYARSTHRQRVPFRPWPAPDPGARR